MPLIVYNSAPSNSTVHLVCDLMVNYLGEDTNGRIDVCTDMVDIVVGSKRNYARAIAGARRGCVGIVEDDWFDEETNTHYIVGTNGVTVCVQYYPW